MSADLVVRCDAWIDGAQCQSECSKPMLAQQLMVVGGELVTMGQRISLSPWEIVMLPGYPVPRFACCSDHMIRVYVQLAEEANVVVEPMKIAPIEEWRQTFGGTPEEHAAFFDAVSAVFDPVGLNKQLLDTLARLRSEHGA